jgi:16S rRNA (guanine966-N2)-methyltransferase
VIKIIGGEFRGRNILASPGKTTRPMTAMVKKSLFDTLAPYMIDANVADIYCGTGTIGLEALSRGARLCHFAEMDRHALDLLRRNIETLNVAGSSVIWAGDVVRRLRQWLDEMNEPLDLAFVDPPFPAVREWDWSAVQETIFDPLAAKMSAGGLVALRLPAETDHPENIGDLQLARTKHYGGMKVLLLERADKET